MMNGVTARRSLYATLAVPTDTTMPYDCLERIEQRR